MRLAESPAVTAAVITGKNSRHRLTRPAFDPEVGMAGFGSIFSPEPGVEMAGLARMFHEPDFAGSFLFRGLYFVDLARV